MSDASNEQPESTKQATAVQKTTAPITAAGVARVCSIIGLIAFGLGLVMVVDTVFYAMSHWADGFSATPPARDVWHGQIEIPALYAIGILGFVNSFVLIISAATVLSDKASAARSNARGALGLGIFGVVIGLAVATFMH